MKSSSIPSWLTRRDVFPVRPSEGTLDLTLQADPLGYPVNLDGLGRPAEGSGVAQW